MLPSAAAGVLLITDAGLFIEATIGKPVESVAVPGLLERLQEQGRLREGTEIMPLVSGNVLRTLPGSFDGDGFFAAVLERR